MKVDDLLRSPDGTIRFTRLESYSTSYLWEGLISYQGCAKLRPLCVSFTAGFEFFLDAITKAKKLIHESIAQNLKQVSLTKRFLAMALIYSYLT